MRAAEISVVPLLPNVKESKVPQLHLSSEPSRLLTEKVKKRQYVGRIQLSEGYSAIWITNIFTCLNIDGYLKKNFLLIFVGLSIIDTFTWYNQTDVTFRNLFSSQDALHVSGGSSAHHQEHKNCTYSVRCFVRPMLLPAAAGSSIGLTKYLTLYVQFLCS